MNYQEAIEARHSVRSYSDRPIEEEIKEKLNRYIAECNDESGLHIQSVYDEPKAFDSFMAHYGKFSGVNNYIALIGKSSKDLDEKIGYYGEKIALYAQTLGLNTCWVAMTYKKIKTAYVLNKGEKLCIVLALGYGLTQGVQHRSKAIEEVSDCRADSEEWFRKGVEAALKAPTAMNQQKFFFSHKDGEVEAKAGLGFYSAIDLGIAKCHFEIGAEKGKEIWK